MMHRSRGMTLMELMITLLIVAILAAVAIPSYRDHSMRGHRTEAAMALTRIASRQEQFYMQNNTYTANLADLGMDATTEHGRYGIALTNGDANAFVARATALGGQADDTGCEIFAINEDGVRYGGPGPVGAAIDMSSHDEQCWRGR